MCCCLSFTLLFSGMPDAYVGKRPAGRLTAATPLLSCRPPVARWVCGTWPLVNTVISPNASAVVSPVSTLTTVCLDESQSKRSKFQILNLYISLVPLVSLLGCYGPRSFPSLCATAYFSFLLSTWTQYNQALMPSSLPQGLPLSSLLRFNLHG